MALVFAVLAFGILPSLQVPGQSAPAPVPDVELALSEQGISAYRLFWRTDKPEVMAKLAIRTDGVGYWARLWLASYLKGQSMFAEASSLMKEAISMRGFAEPKSLIALRSEYADTLLQAGNRQAAFAEWSELLVLKASGALDKVNSLAPDRASLALSLVAAKLHREALEAANGDDTPVAALARARSLAGLNQLQESARQYSSYLNVSLEDSKARLEYASVLERSGKFTEALREFEQLGTDGLYGKGRVLAAMNRRHEAAAAYAESNSWEAKRRAAIIWQDLGYRERAIDLLLSIAKSDSSLSQEAVLRAFSVSDVTRNQTLAATLEPLMSPGTAWMRGTSSVPKQTAPQEKSEPAAIVTAQAIIDELGPEKGLDYALMEVEVAASRMPSDPDLIALGQWLQRAGRTRVAVRIGLNVSKRVLNKDSYTLLYPLVFTESVNKYAQQTGLDPYLVMAIIREESAYEHDVVSSAGAVGLMQLMPATAKSLAPKLGMPATVDLTDPDSNIRLGTAYFGEMMGRFETNVARSAAAYNAGPGSMNRWLATASARSNRYLIEAITYAETRAYVLRVVNSWMMYRWLYAGT